MNIKSWDWRKIALASAAAILIILVAVAVHMYSQVSAVFDEGDAGSLVQETDPDIRENGERFYNILLLGIDYDEDDTGRTYADSVDIDGRVLFTAAGLVPAGEFVNVRITGVSDGDLTGEIEE